MVLGTVNATPLEMAGAYSTFANRGTYTRPDIITRVEQVEEDGEATVLYQRQVASDRVLSETQADLVTHALRGVVIDGGTGEDAAIDRTAAGKTGTAQENKASWFAGYVPGMTAAVWMGYPDATYDDDGDPNTAATLWPMNEDGRLVHGRDATGGSFPAEMWRKFMEVAAAATPRRVRRADPRADPKLARSSTRTCCRPPTRRSPPPPDGGGGGPDWSIPDLTLPTMPRPGGTTPSTRPGQSTTTTTTDPDDTRRRPARPAPGSPRASSP